MSLTRFQVKFENLDWQYGSKVKNDEEHLRSALERDRNEYLPEDILAISDRASMLNHVEMRMPYLDLTLSDFIRQLPARQIMMHGPKWILKELLLKYKGNEFVKRSKEGFGFPFGLWIQQKKFSHLVDFMRNHDTILEPYLEKSTIHKILNEHLYGKVDNSQEIWSILILLLWVNNKFD
jgi:asparagine synthase (glutamine-hydrolysing)